MNWQNSQNIGSRSYKCGHCGNSLASTIGYFATAQSGGAASAFIYICHFCWDPTLIKNGIQIPGATYGNKVKDIQDEGVENLYNEARNCISCNAFTASVLASRKLLMNIAVSKGAEVGKSFQYYVEYLSNQGYIPPNGKEWVDHIRKKGNEATHEITIVSREDAEELIDFLEMLLKFIFEFPATIKKRVTGG